MFTRDKVGLLYSLPLDAQDKDNLRRSRCTLVELTWNVATESTVDYLAQSGVRTICARLGEYDYYTHEARRAVADRIPALRAKGLTHIQVGVEPEHGVDMRYASRNWQHERAYLHGNATHEMSIALFALGVHVISAGWTARGWYRNWDEGVQPGLYAWTEETRLAYDECDYNGMHLYMADGTQYDIEERARIALWEEQARRHKPLWIDEVGVTPSRGTERDKMALYLRLATYLLRTERTTPLGGAGERVEAFIPFISNGDGVGWDIRYLIRDPWCYDLLSAFYAGGGGAYSPNGRPPA